MSGAIPAPAGRSRRVRYLEVEETAAPGSAPEPQGDWYEIVGVVPDMGMDHEPDPKVAGLYHPLRPAEVYPVQMAVHVKGPPAAFGPRLRELAADVDPRLRLSDVVPLDQVNRSALRTIGFFFWLSVLVSAVALLLALAGVYAVMSFTVSQRTREIGIRIALGAEPRRIVRAIFRRPLAQVGLGIVAGGVLTTLLMLPIYDYVISLTQVGLVLAYAALMMMVCLLACLVPTRRALRISPTEALRADA